MIVALTLTLLAATDANAWTLVERAAQRTRGIPTSPVTLALRSLTRDADPLFDDDITASFDAVRATDDAINALDAALVERRCALPVKVAYADVMGLADAVVTRAVLLGASGKKSSRVAAEVGRAVDITALLARCEKPTLESARLFLDVHERTRAAVWFMAEQRFIDATTLAGIATSLADVVTPAILERAIVGKALDLAAQDRVEHLGQRLDAAKRDVIALKDASFEAIPRTKRTAAIRCEATPDPKRFTVTRLALSRMTRQSSDALLTESVVLPKLDGSAGFTVVRAGPIAKTCGFKDGDSLLEVNRVPLTSLDDATMRAPARAQQDGFASFRVKRGNDVVDWRVDVLAPR